MGRGSRHEAAPADPVVCGERRYGQDKKKSTSSGSSSMGSHVLSIRGPPWVKKVSSITTGDAELSIPARQPTSGCPEQAGGVDRATTIRTSSRRIGRCRLARIIGLITPASSAEADLTRRTWWYLDHAYNTVSSHAGGFEPPGRAASATSTSD